MKPCSAWCRPDEGVHVTLPVARGPAGSGVGYVYRSMGNRCVPFRTTVEIIAEEEPAEAAPGSCAISAQHPYAVLTTVRVLS